MLVRDRLDKILFTWCHLCLHELVHTPINTPKGVAIVVEKPYGKKMVNANRPAVHRQCFGRDRKKGRVTYGIGSGANTIGSDGKNFVTKPFNYYLHRIAKYLQSSLYYRRCEFNLETTDVSQTLNHCTIFTLLCKHKFEEKIKYWISYRLYV